jgi:hypothetical protein
MVYLLTLFTYFSRASEPSKVLDIADEVIEENHNERGAAAAAAESPFGRKDDSNISDAPLISQAEESTKETPTEKDLDPTKDDPKETKEDRPFISQAEESMDETPTENDLDLTKEKLKETKENLHSAPPVEALKEALTETNTGAMKGVPNEKINRKDSLPNRLPQTSGQSQDGAWRSGRGQNSVLEELSIPAQISDNGQDSVLFSNAAERRRSVAACRALRAQITRFEDASVQLHGRNPRGAVERSPLATTYAHYRYWKRVIRADAVCRIQALFRGTSTRWMLLRSNNPEISKVVRTRAGWRGFALPNDIAPIPGSRNSVLEELSVPADIGDNRQDSALSSNARLYELQVRKQELKYQLKQYDRDFVIQYGRVPDKAEKEPIRELYERYNALKSCIYDMEEKGRRSSSPTAVPNSSDTMLTQLTVSTVGADSKESIGRTNPSGAPSAPAQVIACLKIGKGILHQMLRSFEEGFFNQNQRRVQSFADIRPVASQYRLYKDIKRAIDALQRGERSYHDFLTHNL